MSCLICIKHKGKSYCWNSETEQVEEVTTKPVNIGDCPDVVVFDLMRLLGRRAKEAKEAE